MKRYTIFAGVNGAGKSTFYHQYYKPSDQEKRINTDEMVARVGTWRDDNLQLRCGKEAVKSNLYVIYKIITFIYA